jgi:hypothetical protein
MDVTVTNIITLDIKDKRGKCSTGVKAPSREVSKFAKYQDLCHVVGIPFLSILFETQCLTGQRFLEHFD